ncbi:hypothetical protein ElyMa_001643800 [Elysia marginata]|uniref:Uncharacterized protein n=1 Tax=Elysia marginata TaxID=1093978 RepID=A0AAV4JQ10_9GAST|nr:hypothetical protein ElyMa_001643800 [Elysia marginata]
MECDRDLSMVNKRRQAETQQHWVEEFQAARKRPSPFNTIEMGQEDFFSYTEYLKPLFKQTCPVPTRPIREILFYSQNSMIFFYRNN